MKNTLRTLAALAAFFAAAFAQGGAQCRMQGTISDSAGNPVDGASVTITTPNLTSFKTTIKADANGHYSTILQDCTMPYHVKYEKEGFAAQEIDKKIPIGEQATIDMKLAKPSEVAAAKGGAPAPAAQAAPSPNEEAVLAFNKGVEAMQAGDKAGAEAKFQEAVAKNPDLPNGWQVLTQMAYEKKDWAHVLEYGQKFIGGVVFGIGRLFLVLMVAAFILIDLDRIQAFLRSLVPERYQGDYDRIYVGIDRGLSGVIRGQLLICLINGILTYIGLWLFKVKYPLLLAGMAATMSLIPIFGSILSSIPIVAVALISSGNFNLLMGVKVLAWIILIHLIEANFLNPKIMGNAAKIHPVLVVFALIAGEHSYGLVGALFAVPVASIIQTIFLYYRRRPKPPVPGATPPSPIAAPLV